MDLRSVQRRCEARLRTVGIPEPFDLDRFADEVSRRRRRRLTLLPKQTSLGPCGVWLALPDADYVFYEPHTSDLHREHIVLHELGHLVHEHEPTEGIDAEVLAELFPTLDGSVVRRVLARTSYTTVEEQEAEMFASLVRGIVDGRMLRRTPTGQREDPVLGRLRSTLGVQRRESS
jgi:hypothetical protein